MAKQKKRKAKYTKPDDHFSAGPLEFARFGRVVIGRSRATKEQFEAAQAQLVAQYPIAVAEIDVLVAEIAAQIVRLPPRPSASTGLVGIFCDDGRVSRQRCGRLRQARSSADG
ncbi:hypothetical protein [Tardiphaga sp. vice278]|uniref:hypothetical protein n=1 Tax=Tardiphaga sp. vice278 TaxID=2592815 RepID=UPI001164D0ED|nr:hypothetical protein [Tardiphaga sp. vice278]QDM16689.1 hypothetical protein FNL53_12715 [Tardiphaga sp. vice278]